MGKTQECNNNHLIKVMSQSLRDRINMDWKNIQLCAEEKCFCNLCLVTKISKKIYVSKYVTFQL